MDGLTGIEKVRLEIEQIQLRQVREFLAALSPSELHRVVTFFRGQMRLEPLPPTVEIKLKPKGDNGPGSDDSFSKNVTLKVVAAKLGL